ncbi:hypothetical protein I552_9489 [Mycobacterium xenopi 3993]|nr:hypothetical protein I552_9489 [Mycobacterium xenopi 3993]
MVSPKTLWYPRTAMIPREEATAIPVMKSWTSVVTSER